MDKKVSCSKSLSGEITVPSDKSISHRAVMLASLAKGQSVIKNFSRGQDPISTLKIFSQLGIVFHYIENNLIVKSEGILTKSSKTLNCGNSGTTMRLLAGILAGQSFDSVLVGDKSLSKRPMKRIIEPLTLMGARIESTDNKAPLKIYGNNLFGINYVSKLSSAQVKSAVLLAGLNAEGETSYTEPFLSRNHSELMLSYMNADIRTNGTKTIIAKSDLNPKTIEIPGDISSAAFFIVGALIIPNSSIILKNVGLNPTRTGILDVIKLMGGNIEILDQRTISNELVGDVKVSYSELNGCELSGELIPRIIDEIPVIAVMATQANGTTIISGAQDLRNKESDRIKAVVTELKKMGADIEIKGRIIEIKGPTKFKGRVVEATDLRAGASLLIAALAASGKSTIKNAHHILRGYDNLVVKLSSVGASIKLV